MTIVIHKGCGGNVLADVTSGISALGDFSVQKTGIRVERIKLGRITTKIKPKFYCLSCQEGKITQEELQILCNYCGERTGTMEKSLFFPALGGFYCKKCQKKHVKTTEDKKGKKTALSLFSNISLISSRNKRR